MIEILTVNTAPHYQHVRKLIEEYAAMRKFDAALANLSRELDQLSTYYPLILLAFAGDQPTGCVAIQELEAGICEMKRLFVSPHFRGQGIGALLIAGIIKKAKRLGYSYMRLDTHPSMTQAQALYRRFGFTEIGRYNQNPIPGIRFFELRLSEDV